MKRLGYSRIAFLDSHLRGSEHYLKNKVHLRLQRLSLTAIATLLFRFLHIETGQKN